MEKKQVQPKTPMSLIFLTSPFGMATTQTAVMQSKLKAALPTMVEGPRAPAWKVGKMPMTFRRISGALEPSAMSVRLATVGFHTILVTLLFNFELKTRTFWEVIFSIAPMKTSAMMATPMKHHRRPTRYSTIRSPLGQPCSASPPSGKIRPPPPTWQTSGEPTPPDNPVHPAMAAALRGPWPGTGWKGPTEAMSARRSAAT
mmetsp:Transcript_123526/g.395121  ORF Transcript_123526/g.395121 Transcript_123526/m.395121 type:complete len:201 (+) Transcript_123526:2572-3174(+)